MFLRFEKLLRYAVYLAVFIAGLLMARMVFGQTRYVVPCPHHVAQASLDSLQHFVGITEATGHNDGYDVAALLRHVGLPQGNAWCAATQVAAIDTARGSCPLPIARTGLANGIFNDAARRGHKTAPVLHVGDLMVWRHPGTSAGHIARVTRVQYPWALSIEGNTSNGAKGSQRNGNGCFRRMRKIGPLAGMELRGFVGLGQ